MISSRRILALYWLGAGAVWAFIVYVLGPLAVRAAYAGWLPGSGLLMSNRANSTRWEYLTRWFDHVPELTFIYTTATVFVFIVLLTVRSARLGPSDTTDAGGDPAPASEPARARLSAWTVC